jgi:hypothetical protein
MAVKLDLECKCCRLICLLALSQPNRYESCLLLKTPLNPIGLFVAHRKHIRSSKHYTPQLKATPSNLDTKQNC